MSCCTTCAKTCSKCLHQLPSSKQVSGDTTVPVPQVTSSKAAVAALLAVVSHFASELQLSKLPFKPDAAVKSITQQPDSITDAASSPSDSISIEDAPSEKSMHTSTPLGSSASTSASSRNAALAAATALHNLLLDKGAQQLVCDLQGVATISKLLVPSDWLLAARAAGECILPAVADTLHWVTHSLTGLVVLMLVVSMLRSFQ